MAVRLAFILLHALRELKVQFDIQWGKAETLLLNVSLFRVPRMIYILFLLFRNHNSHVECASVKAKSLCVYVVNNCSDSQQPLWRWLWTPVKPQKKIACSLVREHVGTLAWLENHVIAPKAAGAKHLFILHIYRCFVLPHGSLDFVI